MLKYLLASVYIATINCIFVAPSYLNKVVMCPELIYYTYLLGMIFVFKIDPLS